MINETLTPTFVAITTEAQQFANVYKANNEVPALPSEVELAKYREFLKNKYPQVIALVSDHLTQFSQDVGHGFGHLAEVSALAGWIVENETKVRQIEAARKETLIQTALLAGFLHDIDRHLGYGEAHMVVGAQTAQKILEEAGLTMPDVVTVVANHDKLDFVATTEDLEIVFGAVFDADHFAYGLERESDFWHIQQDKGKAADLAIHDYEFMLKYLDAWKTAYGKEVGPKFIQFGLAIARHIEVMFSS